MRGGYLRPHYARPGEQAPWGGLDPRVHTARPGIAAPPTTQAPPSTGHLTQAPPQQAPPRALPPTAQAPPPQDWGAAATTDARRPS